MSDSVSWVTRKQAHELMKVLISEKNFSFLQQMIDYDSILIYEIYKQATDLPFRSLKNIDVLRFILRGQNRKIIMADYEYSFGLLYRALGDKDFVFFEQLCKLFLYDDNGKMLNLKFREDEKALLSDLIQYYSHIYLKSFGIFWNEVKNSEQAQEFEIEIMSYIIRQYNQNPLKVKMIVQDFQEQLGFDLNNEDGVYFYLAYAIGAQGLLEYFMETGVKGKWLEKIDDFALNLDDSTYNLVKSYIEKQKNG